LHGGFVSIDQQAILTGLQTLALCVMLISLLTGLANTGTASAVRANNAKLRRRELDFMRVNFLSLGSSQPNKRRQERMELTRRRGSE